MIRGKGRMLLMTYILLAGVAGAAHADSLCINGVQAARDYCITAPGVYEITGEAEDFRLRIEAPKHARVTLALRGASWSCDRGAAIYARSGDITLDLREGVSRISGGSEEEGAAIYVMDDLDIQGEGALHVDGSVRNGIECRDELTIHSGKLEVAALWDGIRGRDRLSVSGGEIHIDTQNDGLKANNDEAPELGCVHVSGGEIRIAAGDDALHAEGRAEVSGGALIIERCFEGIEGSSVSIAGGTIRIAAQDDGVNATGELEDVTITGGELRIDASGDGIDSAGAIVLRGGTIVINGTTSPRNSALDYMESSRAEGSILFASGSASMAQAPKSVGDQCTLRVYFDVMQSARKAISLCDEQDRLLVAWQPGMDYQAIVMAHPLLAQGKTVSLYQGGSMEGLESGEFMTEGTMRGAQLLCTFALDDVLVSVDERGNPCDFVPNSLGW